MPDPESSNTVVQSYVVSFADAEVPYGQPKAGSIVYSNPASNTIVFSIQTQEKIGEYL